MAILSRLLRRVGARDISISRAEDNEVNPRVYVDIWIFGVKAMFYTLGVNNDFEGCRFVFSIDWNEFKKCVRCNALELFLHGQQSISVTALPRKFQNSFLRSMMSNMQSHKDSLGSRLQLSFCKDGEWVTFMPGVKSIEELLVWLDLESNDEA